VPSAATAELTRWLPREDVPVVVNSFNRLECLKELVAWLRRAGQRHLYIIDNASSYPPLLAYLDGLAAERAATVVRLEENCGHLALWRQYVLQRLGIETEYVYTDPDVIPVETCPADLIGRLQRILALNQTVTTAGVGLRLDDLPDSYRFKREAIDWERQFWLAPAAPGLFNAPIDTTFALYRPGSGHCLGLPAIRTGWPCLASHRGWYIREDRLTEEDCYYREVAVRGTSNWSVSALPDWLAAAAERHRNVQPRLALVAGRGIALPGFRTLDPGAAPDLSASSLDGAYVLDDIDCLVREPGLVTGLRRALQPNGRLVVHARRVPAAAARGILAHEPDWMEGWQLCRAVLPNPGCEESIGDSDPLLLHLTPMPAEIRPRVPEIVAGLLDIWPGFASVGG